MHDLVIRGGLVVDGTGAAAFEADVAIDGDRVVAVGHVAERGAEEIDARGKLVTPGFVDIHSHYDGQVTWDPELTPSSWHGVTTVVMGSCGVGFAPARPEGREGLIKLMEGVEDIPGSALTEGIRWGWETFPEYLDAIAAMPHAIDFGAQIAHGPLRSYVMGDRGADSAPATAEDIAAMHALVAEALEAGALGFSTSRTLLHKSSDGVPVPGTFATADELFGIGRALAVTGRGVFQCASDHLSVPKEFEWFKALALEIGRPVMFNMSQTDLKPKLWRDLVGLLEDCERDGAHVIGQVAGRAIGIMMSWHGTAHPFAGHETFAPLAALSPEARVAELQKPEVRAALLAEPDPKLPFFEAFITRGYHKMFVSADGVDYEPSAEQSVAAIAKRRGVHPREVAYEALMANDGQGMIYFPLFNYANENLDLLHELHQHPRTLMGLSDAGAHCGAICDGGMPTFMLTHWTRDRQRGPTLPVEHIVRRQTRDTARAFGLLDRGVLAPGYLADVNVIDYDNLRFEQPKMAYDLPAGGRRLTQRARGYVATVKRGVVISRDDTPTGALPGQLVRGAQPAPE
ncbi:MAG: D-aminoacylase [Deltaproteobacteria bacterium]|nr:MAG: D-aminoacylase [Deltaproteobacteria bacterium]